MKASGQVMTKKVTDLTKGNITKHILRFYWPLLLTSMLQQLYNFVDTLIVGRTSGAARFAAGIDQKLAVLLAGKL